MKVQQIIGADLSKKSIDFANSQGKHIKVSNDLSGYQELMDWIKKQKINMAETMIVMEHTGLYSYRFEQFLHGHRISFTKVSALAIKRSMGLVRGKNDKVDSIRIARYGFEKRDSLVADTALGKSLERLQMLHSTRERLVRHRASLIAAVNEYQSNCSLKSTDLIISSHTGIIKRFDQEIRKVEDAIAALVEKEEGIKHHSQLLQSVTGVGKVVSQATIIKTRNFTKFSNSRKFACHCGIAPFEHSSGSSIRGKTKVSHLADKEMKTLLNLAAKSAIQHDKELKEYYQRRIAEGKSKMSTINIVRNKILSRMFAVIKRQTPFIKDYLHTA